MNADNECSPRKMPWTEKAKNIVVHASQSSVVKHISLLFARSQGCLLGGERLVLLPHCSWPMVTWLFHLASGNFLRPDSSARRRLSYVGRRRNALGTIRKGSQGDLARRASITPQLTCQHVRLSPGELLQLCYRILPKVRKPPHVKG